jgi:hypothetical protein
MQPNYCPTTARTAGRRSLHRRWVGRGECQMPMTLLATWRWWGSSHPDGSTGGGTRARPRFDLVAFLPAGDVHQTALSACGAFPGLLARRSLWAGDGVVWSGTLISTHGP